MRRTRFALALSMLVLCLLAGCSGGDRPDPDPRPMGELVWPDHALAALVPRPSSTVGEVQWEYEDKLNILVGDMTHEDYLDYTKACKEAGFSVVETETDGYFSGENEDGYRLELNYLENDSAVSMTISDPLYAVSIQIDCSENLLFSRYDVDVYLGYTKLGSIEHGGEASYEAEVEKGTQTLRIVSQEDDSVDGEYEFQVPDTLEIRCKAACSSEQVDITVIEDIALPVSVSELVGMPYEEAEKLFRDAGLRNVSLNEIKDLTGEAMSGAGLVTTATVDGNGAFLAGDEVAPEAEIVIEYHSAKEYSPPYDRNTAAGLNYEEVVEAFTAAGFTNVTAEKRTEAGLDEDEEGTVATVRLGDGFPYLDKTYPADVAVVVEYYDPYVDEPADELSSYYAHKFFREHGESQYPYGFEPHFVMGLINEEQIDSRTIFIKVEVTITNAYGQEYDTVAEGTVSGTDDFATVTGFYVS